jgi:putative DNA primase/helicase
MDLGLDATLSAVRVVADRARFHPVRDWLQSLRWDGHRRVRTWLTEVMGCDDTPYTREVGGAFLISAVARIMSPGSKVDTVIILEGDQGTGKSSVLRALAGDEWFLEMSVTDVSNKDAMQILKRKWIAEFPEWDGFSKADAAQIKSYVSRQVDTYRESYGRGPKDFPRQIVFAATTNKDAYMVDETGARRYHPVRCRSVNVALVREIREQLWAEALAMYQGGVPWHVSDPELAAHFVEEQGNRRKVHPWEEKIALWLERPVDIPMGKKRSELGVTTADVLEGALKIDVGRWTQREANEAAACLRALGWRQAGQRRRGGVRVRPYFPDGIDPEDTATPVTRDDLHELPEPPEEPRPSDEELSLALGV